MDDIGQSIFVLNQLKHMGLKISIDDFGTGYSSLNYLKQLPVDTLKINKTFVSDVMHNTQDKSIVATIISMANNMKLNVIAEGIETADQLYFLKTHGRQEGQGYLLSKPLSINKLNNMVVHN